MIKLNVSRQRVVAIGSQSVVLCVVVEGKKEWPAKKGKKEGNEREVNNEWTNSTFQSRGVLFNKT